MLDEATANLEPAHEQAVLDAVLSGGRTTVLVAHRLQVAEQADRVLVIEGGRLVEDGPHQSLLEAGGAYAALWGAVPVAPRRTRRRRRTVAGA